MGAIVLNIAIGFVSAAIGFTAGVLVGKSLRKTTPSTSSNIVEINNSVNNKVVQTIN